MPGIPVVERCQFPVIFSQDHARPWKHWCMPGCPSTCVVYWRAALSGSLCFWNEHIHQSPPFRYPGLKVWYHGNSNFVIASQYICLLAVTQCHHSSSGFTESFTSLPEKFTTEFCIRWHTGASTNHHNEPYRMFSDLRLFNAFLQQVIVLSTKGPMSSSNFLFRQWKFVTIQFSFKQFIWAAAFLFLLLFSCNACASACSLPDPDGWARIALSSTGTTALSRSSPSR